MQKSMELKVTDIPPPRNGLRKVTSADFSQIIHRKITVSYSRTLSEPSCVCASLQDTNNADERTSKKCEFPLLNLHSVSSITQLMPFFRTLSSAFKTKGDGSPKTQSSMSLSVKYPDGSATRILKQLEESVERDFLETLES